MSQYTPTTAEVRDDWEALMLEGGASTESRQANPSLHGETRRAQFDRWLAEVVRAAKYEAWAHGVRHTVAMGVKAHSIDGFLAEANPHRKEATDEREG